MFDRLLAVACVCIVVALILYFFYWNRFIAFLIGQAIRILYWNQEASSIWVEIGSIHFSLLTGRILLKDVQYHSSNQTIKIVKGQIQWRYWIRRPTSEDEIHSVRGEDSKYSKRLWSCRIQLHFQGVEWFIYNRTAAYDNIISQMERESRPTSRLSSRHFFNRFSRQDTSSPVYPPSFSKPPINIPSFLYKGFTWFKQQLPNLDPKDLLPLGINVQTGAIILGNPSTPNLLVAEFQDAFGTYGIVPSRSKHDLYKQVLNIRFQAALICLVKNDAYVDSMTIIGSLVHSRAKLHSNSRMPSFYQSYRSFIRLWRQLGLYRLTADYFATRRAQRVAHKPLPSSLPGFKRSKGGEEDTPIGIDFSAYEYAIERKILEAPVLESSYYVDVVGEVPEHAATPQNSSDGMHNVGNGDVGPEWGFDLVIFGGTLRYGPWVDRQRAEIQRVFFPPTYQNAEATSRLKPGDKRLWTALQIFVELREETSLNIPFREASKDWQWDGVIDTPQRPRKREAAFFNVTVGDRSSINYVMPITVGPSGYESTLEVHLDTLSITSSLNDIRLITAESTRVRCELPAPIRWDEERTWTIAVYLRQPILFLLRDHINMFTDLGRDWVTGPPTDYYKFIPMIYSFHLELHHFEMHFYANDQNIIDKPLIREDNAMLSLRGSHLKSLTTIPSNIFRPESTSIIFTVDAPDLVGSFSLPRWSTHAFHTRKEGIRLFKTKSFHINGSYCYFTEIHEEHIEQLKLEFDLSRTVYHAYGWSIRYFMALRDNYLGSFTHFQTLYEYLDKQNRDIPVGDPLNLKYRPGKSNMLQVDILLRADKSLILLPTSLVGSTSVKLDDPDAINKCISLSIPDIQLQFRMHDYYMEMSLNLGRIRGSVQPESINHASPVSAIMVHEILTIDGMDIVANRLFGPQPRTATYVCIWEIVIGKVQASMSAKDANILAAAGKSFGLNFVDVVNAPAEAFIPAVDPDVTFYKVSVREIDATWKAGNSALLVQLTQGIKFDSNDLGTHQYRKVSCLKVPSICAKILLTASINRNIWLETAEIISDVYLDTYSSPQGHRTTTRSQLAFIEEQDKPTGRAKRMFDNLRHGKSNSRSESISHRSGVYLPQPTLPRRAAVSSRGNPSPRSRPVRVRPPSWHLSTLADLSDSEGEEGVSEADRDARLARTRTSTPVPNIIDDEVTMSSGDESDNADLTEGDSLGDDWSDIGTSVNEQTIGSLMSFYSPIVRHYAANCSPTPAFWEGRSFSLLRECTPFLRQDTLCDKPSNVLNSTPFVLPEGVPADEDITTFRLKCHRPFSITFNPLLVRASFDLLEDVMTILPDAEMCIDSLLGECISKVSTKTNPGCSVIDLDVPGIRLRAIQHVTLDEGNPKISKVSVTPTNMDVAVIADANVTGIRFSGIFGQHTPVLNAYVEEISVSFSVSEDKRTLRAPPDSVIFELAFYTSSIRMSPRNFHGKLGTVSIEISHRGPAWVSATCIPIASTISQLSQNLEALKPYQIAKQRNVVDYILNASQEKPVIDPLSTIQPSYLVQTGMPRQLRNDVSFRFIYHLRACLWTMEHDVLDRGGPPYHQDPDELNSSVEARLTLLDQDAHGIEDLTSMGPLFLDVGSLQGGSKSKIQPMDSFVIQLVRAKIMVIAPTGPSSEFTIVDFTVDMQSKKQDLVQFNFNNQSNASQTSLRSKTSKVVRKTALFASVGDVTLVVAPLLMDFAQQILRVKRQLPLDLDQSHRRSALDYVERSSVSSSGIAHVEITALIRQLSIQAAAENLIVVMGVNGMSASSTLLKMQGKSTSTNGVVLFDEVYLQARSPTNPSRTSDKDILASVALINGRLSVLSKSESGSRMNWKFVVALTGFNIYVPRSALRLYRFIEEWRADYLPGIEATINTLLSEYKAVPKKPLSPTPLRPSRQSPILQVHSQIEHVEISLQIMHGTWLSWEMDRSLAYVHNSSMLTAGAVHSFGLQVGAMTLNISSRPNAKDVAPSSRVKLVLPQLSIAGHLKSPNVSMLILLDFIDLKVKPTHWDTLLAVQQKFGQDFNDLVALMQKTRQRSQPDSKAAVRKRTGLHYIAQLKMQGFRVGLEGLASMVFLECLDINGGFTSNDGWTWDLGLSDLALSLASRVSARQNTTFNRNHRSAFVIIDFKISGSNTSGEAGKSIRFVVTKIHAVMQPSSIGEFGDFIDNLQAEMLERREQRALELAAFKEKAQSILKTFDVNVTDVQLEDTSWINNLIVSISIRSIGVAFPLTHDEELQLPRSKSKESAAVRAFLFSIKSIDFATHRGETGQANMQHLCFQFVPRFKQSSPEDFAAEQHDTRNCLLYPEMRAQLRISSVGTSRKVWIKANVNGFVLDIDSRIPNYVFSLIDVYRQGKDRVERLSSNGPRTPLSSLPTEEGLKPSLERNYTAIPTSNIFVKLTFLSGKVRFYSGSASNQFTRRNPSSNNVWEISDDQVLGLGAEVFNLPVVSVWGEYRATPASQKLSKGSEQEPSLLMFNSTVFSSQNTLRPTLLPFLTELVTQIETRMRKISSRTAPPRPTLTPVTPSMPFAEKSQQANVPSSMQICFSLRIDKSKLELTCQPDVNVVAGLHWESGGFVVNVSPGARKVSFSGSVGGLTVGLKHGFLSEDCVKLDARNLAFSVGFTKTEHGPNDYVNSVSIVLDTEFLGGVRFSRLQDILCFKAVWLDRIPIFNNQAPDEPRSPIQPLGFDSVDVPTSRGFSTVVLFRVRRIALEVDLGQSITRINFDLRHTIFRTKLNDDKSEVFLYVADVSISAHGNISGHAHVPSCVFQTIRRSDSTLREDRSENRMLELRLTSGALVANLESDHQKLLHYRAEPLEVEVYDDWSKTEARIDDATRPLQLSFTVTCAEIVAVATVGTIPKLLSYTNKFKANLDTQRQGAYRESQTFRATRTPKPDNPLSAVAEAMLQSARSRFKESGVSYVIRQHMSLRLDLLRLIVFPRTMKDVEIAQFVGRDVRARLDGLVISDSTSAKRDLHLSFSSMVISKYTQVSHRNHLPLEPADDNDGREWLTALFKDATEAIIVGLPSMKMHMISEESLNSSNRILTYDFYSDFVRREGMRAFEDIYITLNMSLYSWLTVLRKNLSREMDQVRVTEDWRTSMATVSTAMTSGSQRRKKGPEPLPLNEAPRSATLPSASTIALSPYGPSSARPGEADQSRSPQTSREHSLSPIFQLPSPAPLHFPSPQEADETPTSQPPPKRQTIAYLPRERRIERLTMRQLGEATPDVMHPFFMKKAGFNLEDSLPQYVNEYATAPLEEIMDVLMKLYSRQLLAGQQSHQSPDFR